METMSYLLEKLESEGITESELERLEEFSDEIPEIFYCDNCCRYYNSNYIDSIKYNGWTYCENCVDEHFVYCAGCGDLVYKEDAVYSGNEEPYCENCADSLYRCDHCGEFYVEEDMLFDNYGRCLCRECYGWYYYTCSNCGAFIHRVDAYCDDSDNIYCQECFEDYSVIKDYCYKPDPIFYGCGNRYLGIELEVDRGGESHSTARDVIDILDDFVYCKHDGSLDYGFEIVSYPATLDYHMNNVDWERALQYLRDEGYESHDAGTCGLHIHMNRDGFGETEGEQESGIAKVLFFFERHWANIVKFSRRTPEQLDEWASRYLSITPKHPVDVLEYAKSDMSRYRCVNLCNHSTVEVRVFRGSLIYETFMATLQFCDLLYDIAEMPLERVMDITWNEFKEMGSKYKEFTSYLERRGI